MPISEKYMSYSSKLEELLSTKAGDPSESVISGRVFIDELIEMCQDVLDSEARINWLQSYVDSAKERDERLKKHNILLSEKLESMTSKRDNLARDNNELERELRLAREQLGNAKENSKEREEKLKRQRDTISRYLNKKIELLNDEADEMRAEIRDLKSKLELASQLSDTEANSDAEVYRRRLINEQHKSEMFYNDLERCREVRDELSKLYRETRYQLKEQEDMNAVLKSEISLLEIRVTNRMQQIEELKSEIEQILSKESN